MSERYGRAQFLRDAARLGIAQDVAYSRLEVRRRRDRLIIVHHPDRGGDADKAARINAIYARMVAWLDEHQARAARIDAPRTNRVKPERARSFLSEKWRAGAARVSGLAVLAAATYVAFRHTRKQ